MIDTTQDAGTPQDMNPSENPSVRVVPQGAVEGQTSGKPGFFDPLVNTSPQNPGRLTDPPLIEFRSPSELRAYQVPENLLLVGDYHITKGATFVIGGAPGVGKSRACVALAVAAAIQRDWFGLRVHRQFRTLILQAENGRVRLKNECRDLPIEEIDAFIRISLPPPFGLAFWKDAFVDGLRQAIAEFLPDVVLVDPWNQLAKDSMEKDYWAAFEKINAVLPPGDQKPALGIIAHTRKPRLGERASGRSLLNLLAGSYVLTSVPRSVFVIQAAADDPDDDRIVWTCCKNNDGELGPRSVWRRRNGLFVPVEEFDWEGFDGGGTSKRKGVTEDDLKEVFQSGEAWLPQREAVQKVMEVAGVGRTAAYEAVKLTGRFGGFLVRRDDGLFGVRN